MGFRLDVRANVNHNIEGEGYIAWEERRNDTLVIRIMYYPVQQKWRIYNYARFRRGQNESYPSPEGRFTAPWVLI